MATTTQQPVKTASPNPLMPGTPGAITPIPTQQPIQPVATQTAPVTQPAAPAPTPAAGSLPAAPAGANVTPINPAQSYRGQTITPVASPQLQQLQGYTQGAAQQVAQGPDRTALAQRAFDLYRQSTEPAYQQQLRQVGQRAAALGRVGAGLTTSELGDVATLRNRALAQTGEDLALQASGQTLQDRLAQLQGLQGAQAQEYGQEAAGRGELRGERGYTDQLAQEAQQNDINQQMLQDQFLNSATGRYTSELNTLGDLGYGGQPGGTLLGAGQQYGQNASNAYAGVGDLLQQYFLNRGQQANQAANIGAGIDVGSYVPKVKRTETYPGQYN